jgi:hypothetical protein
LAAHARSEHEAAHQTSSFQLGRVLLPNGLNDFITGGPELS